MAARQFIWILVAIFFFGSYIASSIIDLLVDFTWYDAVGYSQVFQTMFMAKLTIGVAAGLVTLAFLYANLAFALRQVGDLRQYLPQEVLATPLAGLVNESNLRRVVLGLSALVGLLSGLAMTNAWETVLLYLNRVDFGRVDPIFQQDVGFYIFSLPFFDLLRSYLWSLGLISVLGSGLIYFLKFQTERAATGENVITLDNSPSAMRLHLGLLGALLLLLLGVGLYLDRFEEMHATGGLFTGPGYADINGTLPVLALKAATAIVAAFVLVFSAARRQWRLLVGLAGLMVVVWVGGNLYGSLLQRFVVSPNELERERAFLAFHIEATNAAYALDRVEERSLEEDVDLTMADIENNQATINNIRLWDHEPLLDTFAQIQEIRTYYDFVSVDNDRYMLDGELRQTMLSPRELNPVSLPSRTWVNERLTFTHGYGVTAGPVNRVNDQGLPVLFVQDLPPKSTVSELDVTRPEIYYGEVPDSYVFVKTLQQEFNYPEGDQNIFATYEGEGGVWLGSLWRRLLYSAYTRDLKMLLSDDFTPDTHILVFRNIQERIRKIAPFFLFDRDPYMVVDKGRLKWIFDGYTVSDRYPYSEQVGDIGNYMRNPVKAVIDAYDGTMRFYMVVPDQPIARAYATIFPEMIRPLSELPESLRAHLRHPSDYFNVQALMYATYHMRDVNTFYNKEDQWSVPVVGQKRMEPYYTVMRLPGGSEEEFILMLPFTPRLKDNLAAWMVARSDGDALGKLVVYVFPKQRLIYGPKQMVARINQDPIVSQQVTLWDQSGSNVIRGTLLVIPIEQSLIYIQPLYLRAEDGRIPELKRVVVGYQNEIAMGVDLEDALRRIFGDKARQPPPMLTPGQLPTAAQQVQTTAAQRAAAAAARAAPAGSPAAQAQQHYRAMQDAASKSDWTRFGQELDALGRVLNQLQ